MCIIELRWRCEGNPYGMLLEEPLDVDLCNETF